MPNTVNTRIAVLQEKQDEMTQAINEIKADIKEIKTMLTNNMVTQTEFMAYKQSTDRALQLAKSANIVKMIVSILVTAIITALVVFFFTHKDKL